MNASHELSSETFSTLASGGGGVSAIEELSAAELSKHIILLQGVVRMAREIGHPEYAQAREGYELLAAAVRENRAAAEGVIRYPPVAIWARRTIVACRDDHPARPAEPSRMLAVGAAAAIRADLDTSIALPTADYRVMLPTLGEATVPEDRVLVRIGSGQSAVGPVQVPHDPGHSAAGWDGLQRISLGPLDFLIDDRDPYRMPDLADLGVCAPAEEWKNIFRAAWPVLAAHHPDAASEIATALITVIPRGRPRSGTISMSTSEAFGAIAMSLPPDPVACAETLVHEVQHLKLGAVQDLVNLTLPDGGRRYYAPWRPDPRPAAGLLQGTYAFFGVARFWRRQREISPDQLTGNAEYSQWRDAVTDAVQTLQASDSLTAAGAAFVDGMARVVNGWQDDVVPAEAAALARRSAREHQSRWESAHGPIPRP